MQQLNANPALPHVDITVNGNVTRITRFNMNLFNRAVVILAPVYHHLVGNMHIARRGLYYYYCHRFGKGDSKQFSNDLKSTLKILDMPGPALSIKDESNTHVHGQLVMEIHFKNKPVKIIDLNDDAMGTLLGDEAFCADNQIGDVVKVELVVKEGFTVDRVIVIEKQCVFEAMIQAGWGEKMNAILITPKGYPSKNSKVWLWKFRTALRIREDQCIAVTDYNSCGRGIGHSHQLNSFAGYEKYVTRLMVAFHSAVLCNFPLVVNHARNSKESKFSKGDNDMFSNLFKKETKYYEEVNDARFAELVEMYNGQFKLDLDAVILEYGVDLLLRVLTKVILGGLTL